MDPDGEEAAGLQTEEIFTALSRIRVKCAQPEEAELHAAVARALEDAGIAFVHEARIAPHCRVDFLCGTVAIEIKKQRVPRARLLPQCARYLASPLVEGLILISPAAASLPASIGGKPLYPYSLNRLWGVALP